MRWVRLNTIRARFVAISFFLVLCCTVLLSAGVSRFTAGRLRGGVGKLLAETAFQISDKVDRGMWSRTREVLILAQQGALRDPSSPGAAQAAIDNLQRAIPVFAWIGLADPDGIVVASSQGILAGSGIADRPVFSRARNGLFVDDVHEANPLSDLLPNPTGEPMKFVDIGAPVHDGSGRLRGVLTAHLSWEWVREMNRSFISALGEQHIEPVIVAADRTVLLGPRGMSGQLLDMPIFDTLGEGRHPWQVLTWPDGREYLTGASRCRGYLEFQGLGWTVLVRQPTEVAFAPARQARAAILVAGLFMAVAAGLVAVILARGVTRPLEGIAADARRLRDGELADFPPYRGPVEIEVLSESLREMVAGLARTRGERDSMERLAMVDNLTSLPNRAGFEGYVAQFESEGLRRNETLGILFMDLDGFKGVNDTLGHEAGDMVLREVAGRIRSVLRGHDRAVRLGGDEFVLIVSLERGSARPQAEGLTARLIEAVNGPMEIKGHRVQVGCSIGVAFYPESAADLRQAVRMADAGLYAAKRAGKNQAAYS